MLRMGACFENPAERINHNTQRRFGVAFHFATAQRLWAISLLRDFGHTQKMYREASNLGDCCFTGVVSKRMRLHYPCSRRGRRLYRGF